MGRLGPYELISELDSGGTAEVWRVKREGDPAGRPLVLKRLLPHLADDAQFVARFVAEARLGTVLTHPAIVQRVDWGLDRGVLYLVLEHVEGLNVRDMIRRAPRLEPEREARVWVHIARQVCAALEFAHRARDPKTGEPLGILHCDVSPSNILVSRDGRVKLADWGIARSAHQSWELPPQMVLGKVGYMSPEQLCAEAVDPRSDVFSLGVVLHEMLCGERLFEHASPEETLGAMLYRPWPRLKDRLPGLPPRLDELLVGALAMEPAARIASCAEFGSRLDRVQEELGPVFEAELGAWVDVLRASPEPSSEEGVTERVLAPGPASINEGVVEGLGKLVVRLMGQSPPRPALVEP